MGARISAGRWVASMTLAMVKVLPEPVTPSSTWSRSPALDARDQLGDRLRLVARGLEIGLDDEALAALGLLRPRRPVGNPGLLAKLRPALAEQGVERLGGGSYAAFVALAGHGDDARQRQQAALLGGGRVVRSGLLVVGEPQRLGEVGIDLAGLRQRAPAAISPHSDGLRPLLEPAGRRGAGLVGVGKVIAAVAGIVRRRLQAGLRIALAGLGADPGLAAIDGGVEKVGEGRRDRRQFRARRLGAGGPCGVLGLFRRPNSAGRAVVPSRHNMGRRGGGEKGVGAGEGFLRTPSRPHAHAPLRAATRSSGRPACAIPGSPTSRGNRRYGFPPSPNGRTGGSATGFSTERCSAMEVHPLARRNSGAALATPTSNSASIPGLTSICAISMTMRFLSA